MSETLSVTEQSLTLHMWVSMAPWVTYGGRESVIVVNTHLVGGAEAWDGLVEGSVSTKQDRKLSPLDETCDAMMSVLFWRLDYSSCHSKFDINCKTTNISGSENHWYSLNHVLKHSI